MKSFTPLPAALAALALTPPALADVTPADVWANQGAIVRALGGQLSATLSATGAMTAVTGIRGDFALPMGLGTITAGVGDVTLTDNGDGSVTLSYPAGTEIVVSFDVPEAGVGEVTLRMADGYDQVATGNPGDITYTYDVPVLRLDFVDFDASGPAFEGPDMAMLGDARIEGALTVNDNTGTMRVTEGALLAVDFDGAAGSQDYSFTFAADDVVSTQSGSTGAVSFDMDLALPSDGTGVMALPAALRDGLSIRMNSVVENNISEQSVQIGDDIMQSQSDSTDRMDTTLAIDADGLRLGGTAEGLTIGMVNPMLFPVPLDLAIAGIDANIEFPLLASPDPVPFALKTGLSGISLPDALWSMVDAGGVLPRDPADFNLDLSGQIGSEIDLVDFEALAALEEAETVPFSIHELTIADLLVAAVGAQLSGNGAFTFDNSDLDTFDGLPAPTGSLDLTLVGANALIDNLVAMGLVPEDQAMGARMMMGLFARPGDGPDTLTSNIEVDGATGAITANGQRLQ